MVAVLEIDARGGYELALTPVIAGDAGLPEIPAPHETERILSGLVVESAARGTEVLVDGAGRASVRGSWAAADGASGPR